MKFKIPQNVEVADKILAFLTFKQLIIVLVGGGVAYLIYIVSATRFPMEFYILPIIIVVILTIAIAFFKMENITFAKLVLLFAEGLINSKRRVWINYDDGLSPLDRLNAIVEIELASSRRIVTDDTGTSPYKNFADIAKIVDVPSEANKNILTPEGTLEIKQPTSANKPENPNEPKDIWEDIKDLNQEFNLEENKGENKNINNLVETPTPIVTTTNTTSTINNNPVLQTVAPDQQTNRPTD